jgi:amino acid adenylation domain-containing protein
MVKEAPMDLAQRISKLSPGQRKLFASKLEKQNINIDILKLSIPRENRTHDQQQFPLSFGQERLWFIQQLDPENTAYNIIKATKLEGSLDKHALEKSTNEIIRRHEILRTTFITDKQGPAQVIRNQLFLPLEVIDLKGFSKEKQESEVKEIIRDENRYVFDLTKGPLLRTKLLVLNEEGDEHVFLLLIHHIISDGTSILVFIRELVQLYEAFSQGRPSHLPGLPIQYVDYASWQRRWFGFNKKQEAYWLHQFGGQIPVLTLPTDYPRPVIQDYEGMTRTFNLDFHETKSLKDMALRNKTTLYVVLLTIYNIFLSKLSSQEDIVVGTPVAGRRNPEVQKLIGMFVNTLALRNYPQHHKTFRDFLEEVRNRTLNAFENQEYRYEDIIAKVDVRRDTGRNPLFDVMFSLENREDTDVTNTGLMLKHYETENNTSKFDLTLSAWDEKPGPINGNQEELHFSFEYCTKLFKDTTIERFIGYFKQVVNSVVRDLEIRLADIEIIPKDEKQTIMYDFNDTATLYPKDRTIHQLFEEQVERTPDQIALIGQSINTFAEASRRAESQELKVVTYKELNEKSNQLAHWLRKKGVKPDIIAGIMVERSVEMMIGLLGILKAGGAYLPIDPGFPGSRLEYMLADSNAKILLTRQEIEGLFWPETFNIGISPRQGGQLAYIIYTSGSTGKPKGVAIRHESMVNFTKGMTDIIDFQVSDKVLSLTTISFDIFGLETFVPLVCGAAVIIGTREPQVDPGAAASIIHREMVSIFQLTPSRLQLFISHGQAAASLQLLRYLLVGGEAFPQKLLDQTVPLVNGRIINLYGPTETTIWSTAREVTGGTPINIGKPIANTFIYIMDSHLNHVPIGVVGDIYIGGDGLARGYLNNPGLTGEKFIRAVISHLSLVINSSKFSTNDQCPMTNDRSSRLYPLPPLPHSPIYRTGDLGRWLPDGNIDFLGRVDHQVKIRGFRIELEEIENRLMRHQAITEAVVIAKEGENKDKFLCAYYVPIKRNNVNRSQEIPVSELREFLSVELPDYMIPSYFVPLEQMPLTPNRKIDKKALSKLDDIQSQVGTAFLAPQTDMEKTISQCWMEVLKRDKVGIHDNFFELGGNSMNIIQLNTELKRILAKDIPVVALYRHLTISSFARYLREEESKAVLYGKESKKNQQVESLHRAKNLFKNTIKKTIGAKNAGEK